MDISKLLVWAGASPNFAPLPCRLGDERLGCTVAGLEETSKGHAAVGALQSGRQVLPPTLRNAPFADAVMTALRFCLEGRLQGSVLCAPVAKVGDCLE